MATPNDDAWRSNINAKGQEIQSLIDQVLHHLPANDANNRERFNTLLSTTIQKCDNMHGLFGPNLIPAPLAQLTQTLKSWQKNLNEPKHIKRIVGLYDPIGKINGNEDEDSPSFTSILEKHREDNTLQEFLAELIAALEQLLADGDDILTNQAASELQRILNEIRKRQKMSLADLLPWVEFAMTSVGAMIDTWTGTPIASIAINATLTAKKTQTRIKELFTIARTDFINSLHLKGRAKYEGPFGRALIESSTEAIEAAIKEPGGLKLLPEPLDESHETPKLSNNTPTQKSEA